MKRAIIVGLNYPGTEYELSGCVLDAKALEARMKAAKVHTGGCNAGQKLDHPKGQYCEKTVNYGEREKP